MSKVDEAAEVLRSLGMPLKQQNERSALTLLSLAGLEEGDSWANTRTPLQRILDIMESMKNNYGKVYAPNSRETIRRQTIHQFEQARLVDRNPDDPTRPTNSGNSCYQLTSYAVKVLRSYGTVAFDKNCREFINEQGNLAEAYEKKRDLHRVPVKFPDGKEFELSPGKHNDLQRAIIEEFAPRFAPGSNVLYLGDTANKSLFVDEEGLETLSIPTMSHDKLPDVVLYDSGRNWLFFVEAVTSHGPISAKRHAELEKMVEDAGCGTVYVTAFLDFSDFKKYATEIVWESEVWISDAPDHMIHYNGDRFMGPYPTD